MSSPSVALWRDRAVRFLVGASATLTSAFFGVIRNKWIALNLEASGIGVLAQVASGQMWLGTLAGMGLSLPIARAVGAARGRGVEGMARVTVRTAITLVGAGSIAATVVGLVFAEALSAALLGSAEHAFLLRVSMLGVGGIAFQGVALGLFAGRSDLKAGWMLAFAGGLAAVTVTLVLVPRWGLAGAVLGGAVLWPVGVGCALFVNRRSYDLLLRPGPEPRFDRGIALSIVGIGAAALALTLVDLGTLVAVRAHYLRAHGIEANGLLQAALALSHQVGALFYAYLSNYAFGKVSAEAGGLGVTGVRTYTRRQWTPLLLLAALTFAAAMVASTPLLHVLYSSRFDPARPLMAWALLGEFFRVGMNVWAVGALPLGGTRLWVPIGLAPSFGIAVSYALLAQAGVGVQSLPYAYVCGGLVSVLFGGYAMSRAGVTLSRRAIWLALVLGVALAALAAWVAR